MKVCGFKLRIRIIMFGVALQCAIAGCSIQAVAELESGDIAVVAYNSDNPDSFAWFCFEDIDAGTVIKFTDASVGTNNHFRWSEHLEEGSQSAGQGGPLLWSYSNTLRAGTVVRFDSTATNWSIGAVSNNYPLLNVSGDQLFCYTGVISYTETEAEPCRGDHSAAGILYGLNLANEGWETNSPSGTGQSAIPSGISTSSYTAVYIGSDDNGYYSGPTAGRPGQLLREIADPSNWVTSGARIETNRWPRDFEILPDTLLFEFSHYSPEPHISRRTQGRKES
jgi:hypothetical protein